MPPGFYIPQISFTGFLWPERLVYIIGFTATYIAGLVASRHFMAIVAIEGLGLLGLFSYITLLISMTGMVIQAWVPFQSNTFTELLPGKSDIEETTVFHLAAAGVFFFGSIAHATMFLIARIFFGKSLGLPIKVKLTFLTAAIVSLFVLPWFFNFADSVTETNVMGACQRAGVLFILAYFNDYSRDIVQLSVLNA
jgi:hypothetical protein